MEPLAISMEALFTACTPPKRLLTESTLIMGDPVVFIFFKFGSTDVTKLDIF
jgi:hypothetical protein